MDDCKESKNSGIEEERGSCQETAEQGNVYKKEETGKKKKNRFPGFCNSAQLSILSGLRANLSMTVWRELYCQVRSKGTEQPRFTI